MKFKVIKKDIKEGERLDPFNCPIANAISRHKKITSKVIVSFKDVNIGNNYYLLPKKVQNFIKKFDEGEKVAPIEFKLKIS